MIQQRRECDEEDELEEQAMRGIFAQQDAHQHCAGHGNHSDLNEGIGSDCPKPNSPITNHLEQSGVS